jgi:hypothetical protein
MSDPASVFSAEHHQRFLLAVEASQRELRLAAEVLHASGIAAGIHRHLDLATEWVTEARRLLDER